MPPERQRAAGWAARGDPGGGSDVRAETSAASLRRPVGVGHYRQGVAQHLTSDDAGAGGPAGECEASLTEEVGSTPVARTSTRPPASPCAPPPGPPSTPRWTRGGPTRRGATTTPGRARLLLDAARESVAARLGRPARRGARSRPRAPRPSHLGVAGLARGRARTGDRVVATRRRALQRAARGPRRRDARSVVPVDGLGPRRPRRVRRRRRGRRRRARRACRARTTRSARGSRSRPPRQLARQHDVPLLVDAAQTLGRERRARRLVGAHRERAQVGRPGRRRRAGRAHRACAGAPPPPTTRARAAACPGSCRCRWSSRPRPPSRRPRPSAQRRGRPAARASSTSSARGCPSSCPDVVVLGDPVDRLPHVVTFSCLYVDGESLLDGLDRAGLRGVVRIRPASPTRSSRATCSPPWAP